MLVNFVSDFMEYCSWVSALQSCMNEFAVRNMH